MSKNGLNDYVGHIIEAAQLACVYIDGLRKDDFLADKRTQQAVILNIVVIGEAATKIVKDHPEFIDQYSGVPWKGGMKGMRSRIAHSYFDINPYIVWDMLQMVLSRLVEQHYPS